jgi:hypothetical protein
VSLVGCLLLFWSWQEGDKKTRFIEVTVGKVSEKLSRWDSLFAVPKKTAEVIATRRWFGRFSSAEAQPQEVYTPDVETKVLLSVLARARHDTAFLAQLSENLDKALEDHDLTHEAKAALASGDIHWLESKSRHAR